MQKRTISNGCAVQDVIPVLLLCLICNLSHFITSHSHYVLLFVLGTEIIFHMMIFLFLSSFWAVWGGGNKEYAYSFLIPFNFLIHQSHQIGTKCLTAAVKSF